MKNANEIGILITELGQHELSIEEIDLYANI